MAVPDPADGRLLLDRIISQIEQFGAEAKADDGGASSSLTALLAKTTCYLRQVLGPFAQTEMLTISDVAVLLNCSYGEARNKLLDGRVRAIKDGRWIRTRRFWVERYIRKHLVRPKIVPLEVKPRRKAKINPTGVKAGGVAEKFLQSRPR